MHAATLLAKARRVTGALIATLALVISTLHALPSKAASGYDLSDMWWTPGESGWGVTFTQQRDVIFAALYVQGPDGRPAWYTATLAFQGLEPQTHAVSYAGDLYETTGSYYASPSYAATSAKVGTMSVYAPTLTSASLGYSISGVSISKSIRRLTFRAEEFAPSYSGTSLVEWTKCDNAAENGERIQPTTYQVTTSGLAMTIVATDAAKTCTYTGAYSQDGHLGSLASTYTCSNGEAGAMNFSEMNVQRFGLLAQLFGANNRGCHIDGRIALVQS